MIRCAMLQVQRVALALIALIPACFEDSAPSGCTPGSDGCVCTSSEQCLSGLRCDDGRCQPMTEADDRGSSTSIGVSATSVGSISTSGGELDLSTDGGGSSGRPDSTDSSGSPLGSSSTDASPSAHRVFVTASQWLGSEVVSIDIASQHCAAAIGAGGRWRAILSDSSTTAAEHIAIVGPVVNMQGELVAEDAEELWGGLGRALVGFDEQGAPIPEGNLAWVGAPELHCEDWSSAEPEVVGMPGTPNQSDLWLGTGVPIPCSAALHLYCISQ